jgi:hypothetical protein
MIAAKWHSYQSTCSEMDFDSAMSDYGPTYQCLCRHIGVADGETLGTLSTYPLDCYRKVTSVLSDCSSGFM